MSLCAHAAAAATNAVTAPIEATTVEASCDRSSTGEILHIR